MKIKDGDGDMDSVSATCTPMVSPVVSDSDDVADITARDSAVDPISRYEVNFYWKFLVLISLDSYDFYRRLNHLSFYILM